MGNAAAPLKRPDCRLLGVGLMLALIWFAGFAKNFYLRSWLLMTLSILLCIGVDTELRRRGLPRCVKLNR
jgi:hypothetical protein